MGGLDVDVDDDVDDCAETDAESTTAAYVDDDDPSTGIERVGSRLRARRLVVGRVVWNVETPTPPWEVAPPAQWRAPASVLHEDSAGVLVQVERRGRSPVYVVPSVDDVDVIDGTARADVVDEWEIPRAAGWRWTGAWTGTRWADAVPHVWPENAADRTALIRPGECADVDAERAHVEATIRAWWPTAQMEGEAAGLRPGLMLARVYAAAGLLRVERETGWIYRKWRFHITAAEGGTLRRVRRGWERADVAHVRGGRCVELWNGDDVLRCEAHHVVYDQLCGGVQGAQLIQHVDGNRANNAPSNLATVAQARALRTLLEVEAAG